MLFTPLKYSVEGCIFSAYRKKNQHSQSNPHSEASFGNEPLEV